MLTEDLGLEIIDFYIKAKLRNDWKLGCLKLLRPFSAIYLHLNKFMKREYLSFLNSYV